MLSAVLLSDGRSDPSGALDGPDTWQPQQHMIRDALMSDRLTAPWPVHDTHQVNCRHGLLAASDDMILLGRNFAEPGCFRFAATGLKMYQYALHLVAGGSQPQIKTNAKCLHVAGFDTRARAR